MCVLNVFDRGTSHSAAVAWPGFTGVESACCGPLGVRRYDDLKSAGENIELQTTILSRFDLIFIVKDERNAERDTQIAKCAALSTSPACAPHNHGQSTVLPGASMFLAW